MKLYELITSDGNYEDYQEYTLCRNTDRKVVEKVKKDIEIYFKKLLSRKITGVTDEDISNYDTNTYEMFPYEKWQLIYNNQQMKEKIKGLSELEIVEVEYNNILSMKEIIAMIGV
jgi:hypothetical protein